MNGSEKGILGVEYRIGVDEKYRLRAAELYDEAFSAKFSVALSDEKKRLDLFRASFNLEYAIAALCAGELVGLAGFHTKEGSLTSGISYEQLVSRYGIIEGNWASLILSFYERDLKPGELVMDGIAVAQPFRGEGIGSRLLEEVAKYGKNKAYNRVRLDVVDINSRAKQLYERKGFVAVRTEHFPYLKWLLGFASATTMELSLAENKLVSGLR